MITLLAFHSLFHSLHSYKDTFIVQTVQVNSIIDLLKFNHINIRNWLWIKERIFQKVFARLRSALISNLIRTFRTIFLLQNNPSKFYNTHLQILRFILGLKKTSLNSDSDLIWRIQSMLNWVNPLPKKILTNLFYLK